MNTGSLQTGQGKGQYTPKMKLINCGGETTKYGETDIFNLFNDLSLFDIEINRFEDIIYLRQNNTFKYPLSYRIVYPTKKVLDYFKNA